LIQLQASRCATTCCTRAASPARDESQYIVEHLQVGLGCHVSTQRILQGPNTTAARLQPLGCGMHTNARSVASEPALSTCPALACHCPEVLQAIMMVLKVRVTGCTRSCRITSRTAAEQGKLEACWGHQAGRANQAARSSTSSKLDCRSAHGRKWPHRQSISNRPFQLPLLASWQCRGRAGVTQPNMPPNKPAASRIDAHLTSKGLLPLPALASWQCYSRVQHAADRQQTTTDSNS